MELTLESFISYHCIHHKRMHGALFHTCCDLLWFALLCVPCGRATHGLPKKLGTGVPWVSCRDPPVCHDVQGDIVTERQLSVRVWCLRGGCVVRVVVSLMCCPKYWVSSTIPQQQCTKPARARILPLSGLCSFGVRVTKNDDATVALRRGKMAVVCAVASAERGHMTPAGLEGLGSEA